MDNLDICRMAFMFRNSLDRIRQEKNGSAALVFAFTLPLLIGFAGLGTDTIQWSLWKRQIQRSADSSAVAGVYQRLQPMNSYQDIGNAITSDLKVNKNDVGNLLPTYPKYDIPPDDARGTNLVHVKLAVQKPLSFSGLFLSTPPIIPGEATAAVISSGDYCIVSLESTMATGITGSGTGTVDLNCGMITNSNSLNAAIAKGSSSLTTTVIAAVGGIQQSSNWKGATYLPFTLPIQDPYLNVPGNIPAGTPKQPAFNDKPGSNTTLSPGIYTSLNVQGNVTLSPGTYYIDGGSISLGSQANVQGGGVTLVLTNSSNSLTAPIGTIGMNAGASLGISAPTSGTYQGIVIYQDRRATGVGTKINGNSSSTITGSIYMPNEYITFNGTGSSSYDCMRLVSRQVIFTGTGNMSINNSCSKYGITPIPGRAIRLVA